MATHSSPRSISSDVAGRHPATVPPPTRPSTPADPVQIHRRGDRLEVRGPDGFQLVVPIRDVSLEVQPGPEPDGIDVHIEGLAGPVWLQCRIDVRSPPGGLTAELDRLACIRDEVDGAHAGSGDVPAESAPVGRRRRATSPPPPPQPPPRPAKPPFVRLKGPSLPADHGDWLLLSPLADTRRLAEGTLLVPEEPPMP